MPVFEDTVRLRRMGWIFSICLLLLFPGSAVGQGRTNSAPPLRTDPLGVPTSADENERRLQRDMAKKANLERQAQLKNDTDKLLKLSQELKDYVDKSNENMLSVSVLKKAEEIEKLARSVK